jgi:hypothetical protein
LRQSTGTRRHHSDRHHHLTNWPQREPGELEMRPRERDADDGDGEEKRGDDMGEREPPKTSQMRLPTMPSGPVPISSRPVTADA